MTLLVGFLLVSTLLCALVTGFIFTYAVVVMPGFAKLDDRDFIRAFQVTDGVIQNNQPLFMLAWVGSIVSVVATMILGFIELHGIERWTVIAIGFVYLMGVQGITILIHLPLNNRLQRLEIDEMDPESLSKERNKFETRWNYFNNIRTLIASAVSFSLMLLIYAN
ncbi:MAG TPA: DUF1772 domain-containing protein [Nitrospinaceae bacterium]|jgi:uncharacterized membrane protein|nr:DUF1772 domain-containing protein [SAR324 cluster bacterium]MDP7499803.1 DUF1772 domain-containing protein [SAR324 cluster bacterium]HJO56862.1 DUF1772 domain-containing protein [Nitrospinaceae bacterium]|tara:strand:+ start:50 stop:544 length:495 start_codon:yes stop_codon:yes gene_type:complete